MAFVDDLVRAARTEWDRWGGPRVAIDGGRAGFASRNMEADSPFFTFVGDYWRSIDIDRDGRDPPAWSAAFISFCFIEAGSGERFPSHQNHSIYVSKIDSGRFPGLSVEDPGVTAPGIGDVLWASRTGDDCRTPPSTFAEARRELKKIREGTAGSFCSHSDIVTAIRDGEVDVIGGNVSQAVTRTTYKLDSQGRIKDGRRNFIGVIKNTL